MEVRVLKKEKERLFLEFPTEGYTLLNPLVEALWEEDVKEAAVVKEHPFLATSKLWLVASNPKSKLQKATNKVLKKLEKLEQAVNKL